MALQSEKIPEVRSKTDIERGPPAEVISFLAGDFIEAEIELLALPLSADEYYGRNEKFSNAPQANANAWKMVYRKALGNNIEIIAWTGKLIDSYPIKIKPMNNLAEFIVTAGLGYVPLTITNVGTHQGAELLKK